MGQPGFNLDQDSTMSMSGDLSKSPTCQSPIIPTKVEVEEDRQEEMEVEMKQNDFHWENALCGDRSLTTSSPSPTMDPLEVDVNEVRSNTATRTFIEGSSTGPPIALVKPEELEIHMRDNHSETIWAKPQYCPFCQKEKYRSDLPYRWWRHVMKRHLEDLIHCDVCDKHFANITVFEAHKVSHSADGPVICSICGENSPSKKSFHRHLIYSHSATEKRRKVRKQNPILPCEFCGKVFRSPKGLKTHMLRHLDKEQRKLSCEVCNRSFLLKRTLLKHLHTVHEVDLDLEKKHKCTTCEKMFVSLLALKQHEALHKKFDASDINAKCDICKFAPENHEKLLQHFEETNHDRCKPKKCTVEDCNYSGIGWRNLKIHERRHHPHLFIHHCQLCEKRYSTSEFLETHALTHGDGPFECKVCPCGKCKSAEKLAEHLSRHNGEDTFKCDQCFEAFSKGGALQNHKIKKHGETPSFECTECGKKCPRKYALDQHQARHHPLQDAVKFHCSVCSQLFNTKTQLANHVDNVHSDRYLCCEICGLQVKRPYMLKLHMLRAHSKRNDLEAAKKRICYFCDKKFFLSGELTVHMYTHTGEKPYICYICRKDFTQYHCLKKHLKLHQKDGTFFSKPGNMESFALPEIPQMALSQYLS